MTKKIRAFTLHDPIFTTDILVAAGTGEALNKWTQRKFGSGPALFEPRTYAMYSQFMGEDGEAFRMIRLTRLKRRDLILDVTHEALHATLAILEEKGLAPTWESCEAYTYYHNWLVDEMLTRLLPGWKGGK